MSSHTIPAFPDLERILDLEQSPPYWRKFIMEIRTPYPDWSALQLDELRHIINDRLKEYQGFYISRPGKMGYIRFKSVKAKTFFLLKWS